MRASRLLLAGLAAVSIGSSALAAGSPQGSTSGILSPATRNLQSTGQTKPPGAAVDPNDHSVDHAQARYDRAARQAARSICSNC